MRFKDVQKFLNRKNFPTILNTITNIFIIIKQEIIGKKRWDFFKKITVT